MNGSFTINVNQIRSLVGQAETAKNNAYTELNVALSYTHQEQQGARDRAQTAYNNALASHQAAQGHLATTNSSFDTAEASVNTVKQAKDDANQIKIDIESYMTQIQTLIDTDSGDGNNANAN